MAELPIQPTLGDIFRTVRPQKVYTKPRWNDDWTLREHLAAVMVRWGSGPVRSMAELEWRFGEVLEPGESAFERLSELEVIGHYVKVVIEQEPDEEPLRWYGIITEDASQRGGALLREEGGETIRVLTGEQRLLAEGLDLLLARSQIDSSWIWQSSAVKFEIHRGLTFNERLGHAASTSQTPNRSVDIVPEGCYVFAGSTLEDETAYWSSRQILDYLLILLGPKSASGIEQVPFRLSDRAKWCLPEWDQPEVRADGRDLRSVINEVCDRRRLLDWQLMVPKAPESPETEAEGEVQLDVFSLHAEDLELPSGAIQHGNTNRVQLDFDRAVDVEASLKESEFHEVDQILVRGARKAAVITLSAVDGTLVADWTAEDEAAYEAGPAGIGGLDRDKQERRIREFRTSDKYERVYAYFRLPTDWNGMVGDGIGGPKTPCAPEDPEHGPENFYLAGLRFERRLPLGVVETAPAGDAEAQLAAVAWLKTEGDGTGTARYQYLERLAVAAPIEGMGAGAGRVWAASVRTQPDGPGLIVKVSGGPQHLLAKTDFTPLPDLPDQPAELDWRNNLIVTVMLQLDSSVEARHPPTNDLDPTRDLVRRAVVELGDRARLDWVHPSAVVRIADGVPQYPAAGFYAHDDRPWMQDLAEFLWEWYGKVRQAFTFRVHQISGTLNVGQFITQIGAAETLEQVNATVTGVEIHLGRVETLITTGFGELDPMQFI